jgi:hypothetical protein
MWRDRKITPQADDKPVQQRFVTGHDFSHAGQVQ